MKTGKVILILILLATALNIVKCEIVLCSSESFEKTLSGRRSTHQGGTFANQQLNYENLMKVLWAAYGYSLSGNRTLPEKAGSYSLNLYAVNNSGSYRYYPEDNSLKIHFENVTKEILLEGQWQTWPNEASVILVVVWNRTQLNNELLAYLEAGSLVQNVYLIASELGLGTCCVASVTSSALQDSLYLSQDLTPLLIMPIGYPRKIVIEGYPRWGSMSGDLPKVQYSNMSFSDAIAANQSVEDWGELCLSPEEISQILWAAYGYSSISVQLEGVNSSEIHRTVPSAYARYPLELYFLNSTGGYNYYPTTHSLERIFDEDYRKEVRNSLDETLIGIGDPSLLVIGFNVDKYQNAPTSYVFIEGGCVLQNIFLEAGAQNLGAVFLEIEGWNGTEASSLKRILNLPEKVVPLYIVLMGHVRQEVNLPPEPVILGEPNDLTSDSMIISWTASSSADFQEYRVYQSENQDSIGQLLTIITDRTNTTYSIQKLSPDTYFYFTIRVLDNSGLFSDSNQVFGKTKNINHISFEIIFLLAVILVFTIALLLVIKYRR